MGVAAVSQNGEVSRYFTFVQKLYTFFAQSTHRWNVLEVTLGPENPVLKRLADTRWSAHADAVKALFRGYELIKSALTKIEGDNSQMKDTILEAASLCKKMSKLETVFLTIIWNEILQRFNETNKTVQRENIDLKVVIKLIESLSCYVLSMRDRFDEYEATAKQKCGNVDYADIAHRPRQRSIHLSSFDGPAKETTFRGSTNFKVNTYLPIIDAITLGLATRKKSYEEIKQKINYRTNNAGVTKSSCIL